MNSKPKIAFTIRRKDFLHERRIHSTHTKKNNKNSICKKIKQSIEKKELFKI